MKMQKNYRPRLSLTWDGRASLVSTTCSMCSFLALAWCSSFCNVQMTPIQSITRHWSIGISTTMPRLNDIFWIKLQHVKKNLTQSSTTVTCMQHCNNSSSNSSNINHNFQRIALQCDANHDKMATCQTVNETEMTSEQFSQRWLSVWVRINITHNAV